jgi:SAM-dependent methyltransferase
VDAARSLSLVRNPVPEPTRSWIGISKELYEASSRFNELRLLRDLHDPLRVHDVAGAIASLNGVIGRAARSGMPSDEIRSMISDARAAHARSPFVARLQTWPRGYAGDWETIEYLVRQEVSAPVGSLEYWVEWYCLSTAIAQQHRNKVTEQGFALLRAVIRGCPDGRFDVGSGRGARIAILAAGGCSDIRSVQDALASCDFHVVINDMDPDALRFSLQMLPKIRNRISVVQGNVFRKVRELRDLGPYDLIVAGGLFDYLEDAAARHLLKTVITRLLAPGGHLFFTNIARGNPYQPWLEHVADWHLIERSEAEVLRLLERAGLVESDVTLRRDGTGLAILADVRLVQPV